MISDTIFDRTERMLQELAWYEVAQDYSDDQIQEILESLAKFAAIGTDFDTGGDGLCVTDVRVTDALDRLYERYQNCVDEQKQCRNEPVWERDDRNRRIAWAQSLHDALDGYSESTMVINLTEMQKMRISEAIVSLREEVNGVVEQLEPSDARHDYFEFVKEHMIEINADRAVWILDQFAEMIENVRTPVKDDMADRALLFAVAESRSLRALILWNLGAVGEDKHWL